MEPLILSIMDTNTFPLYQPMTKLLVKLGTKGDDTSVDYALVHRQNNLMLPQEHEPILLWQIHSQLASHDYVQISTHGPRHSIPV